MNKDFEVRKFKFTLENIGLFKRYNFARPLHLNHINKIKKSTRNDNFIIGNAIIVNEEDNEFYVINGGHRIESYKQLLATGATKEITTVIIIYKELSKKEVKSKMRTMGIIDKVQDLDSLLEVYKEDIFIYLHLNELPISIGIKYRKHFFKLRDIFYILQVRDSPKMNYGRSTENTLNFALKTNIKDLEFLKEFLSFFINKFGNFNRENKLWHNSFVIPFASVYGRNKSKVLDNNRIFNLFKDRKIDRILEYGSGGRETAQKMRERIIEVLEIEEKAELKEEGKDGAYESARD